MAKSVKKKDIASNLSDAAKSIRDVLGWQEPEAMEPEVLPEPSPEEETKKKKAKPKKAFVDFAESYRKAIGQ